jgi:hypothetical protein
MTPQTPNPKPQFLINELSQSAQGHHEFEMSTQGRGVVLDQQPQEPPPGLRPFWVTGVEDLGLRV